MYFFSIINKDLHIFKIKQFRCLSGFLVLFLYRPTVHSGSLWGLLQRKRGGEDLTMMWRKVDGRLMPVAEVNSRQLLTVRYSKCPTKNVSFARNCSVILSTEWNRSITYRIYTLCYSAGLKFERE